MSGTDLEPSLTLEEIIEQLKKAKKGDVILWDDAQIHLKDKFLEVQKESLGYIPISKARNPKRFRSGVRAWNINKKAPFDCIIIDFAKKQLSYDQEKFWIRFETQNKLYIYSLTSKVPVKVPKRGM